MNKRNKSFISIYIVIEQGHIYMKEEKNPKTANKRQ